MVRRTAFHVAFRVLLIGVGLSVLAVAALPLFTLPSETRLAIVDRAHRPALSEPRSNRPVDHRRVAAVDTIPGLFGDSSPVVEPTRPQPWKHAAVDEGAEAHSRPVPPPQTAENPFPAALSTKPLHTDSAGPASPSPVEEPKTPEGLAGAPRVFPGTVERPPVEPAKSPVVPGPDLFEMRRDIDRLAESHLQEQRAEIQKAQLVLSEMQNAKQIDLLREEIRTLRHEQAELRSTASAPPPAPPETSGAASPPVPAAVPFPPGAPAAPPVPAAIQIEPGADPSRYTIRLRRASLGAAVNELAVLAGWNVVTGEEFSQSVTATLTDVTAEEAVQALLESHGWVIRRDGRRLLIDRPQPPPLEAPAPTEAPPAEPKPAEPSPSAAALPNIAPITNPENVQAQGPDLQNVSASQILPQPVGPPTQGVGTTPPEAPTDLEGTDASTPSVKKPLVPNPAEDRNVVRDRSEDTDPFVARAVSSLDHPHVDIDIAVLLVEKRDNAVAGIRRGLAADLASRDPSNQICVRCGRRHPVAAPVGPACNLPEPAWTVGGQGWDFAQLRGTPDVFVDAIRRFTSFEVLLRETVRIRHEESTVLPLKNLIQQQYGSQPPSLAHLIDQVHLPNLRGGTVSIHSQQLNSGEIQLSIACPLEPGQTTDAGSGKLAGSEKTEVIVQKDCSLIMAGVEAVAARKSDFRTSRFELVLLLTPRAVPGPVTE